MHRAVATSILLTAGTSVVAFAQNVGITAEKAESRFKLNGTEVVITRNQDPDARIADEYALTSRPCPWACLQPMRAADGVATVGELEVMSFLETAVSGDAGHLLDVRTPSTYVRGTIPGAVNVPVPTLASDNPFQKEILKAFGATEDGDQMDFSGARILTIFDDGPWSDEAAAAVRGLVDAGYPPEKINYYRGGMQLWLLMGLTVVSP